MASLAHRLMIITAAACLLLGWPTSDHVFSEPRAVKIVVLGDSLTARFGLPTTEAFPAILERALKDTGQLVTVVNAGMSGDTAAIGLAGLERSITRDTNAVIVELGANDMLRGFEPNVTRSALAAILRDLEAHRVDVLLCGVRTQPSLGDEYKGAFAAMFSSVAKEHNALFHPAFDQAFVDDAGLKLPDGLHPPAAGIEAVVARILPIVETLIERARRRNQQ